MNITASRLQYLDAIGVQVWEERAEPVVILEPTAEPKKVATLAASKLLQQADWFILKDSSPSQQDAEHLFSNLCFAGNIPQASSYVTAINLDSTTGRQQILAEIEQVQPKVILVLGEGAAQNLLKSSERMSELRACEQKTDDISATIVVSHSPANLIAQPLLKRETWADLQLATQLAKAISIKGAH